MAKGGARSLLTSAGGAACAVRGQHGGGLMDGKVVAGNRKVEYGGFGVEEAEILGRDGLGEEDDGFCVEA